MTLNDLLRGKNIDPEQVLVMRHRPSEQELNRVMPWLAAERPDLFNAYQQSQGDKVERAMQGAQYDASFLGREAGKARVVGLYARNGSKAMAYKACAAGQCRIDGAGHEGIQRRRVSSAVGSLVRSCPNRFLRSLERQARGGVASSRKVVVAAGTSKRNICSRHS